MLKTGDKGLGPLYVGSKKIRRAFVGTQLVYDEIPIYTISAIVSPSGGGTVTGTGKYDKGKIATLKAVPSFDYLFDVWKENGKDVSSDVEYSFLVESNRYLTAKFIVPTYIAGVDWLATTLPYTDKWEDVVYGGDKFVAIAGNGSSRAVYSTDGITWKSAKLPAAAMWTCIAYGDGKFVAFNKGSDAYSSKNVAYSEDGINWKITTLNSSSYFNSATYGNKKFVAISIYGDVFYSSNGINWEESKISSSTSSGWGKVVHGGDKFVSIYTRSNSNTVAYSKDGITWSEGTMPSVGGWEGIAYGNGKFVAVHSGSSNQAAYSTDGINWKSVTLPISAQWYNVTYGNGRFVILSYSKAIYSTDGVNWNVSSTYPSSVGYESAAYGGGRFVGIAYNSNKAAYSFTGN